MEYGALIIPFIVTIIFYLIYKSEYKWWEFFIPLIVTIALVFGAKGIALISGQKYSEYWGETVVAIYEEEPWNEWIHRTCTETYPCGTDANGNTRYCTRTYDCSYQADYGPEWWVKTDLNHTFYISEKLYDSLAIVYNTQIVKTNTHRNHSVRDRAVSSTGTKFEGKQVGEFSYVWKYNWPKTDETRQGVFTKHKYKNKVKSTDLSLFNISVVPEERADSLGLYKYPKKIDKFKCPVILGAEVSPEIHENFRKLNAKFGPSNELRLWILIFKDKPSIYGTYQENYWVRGNKNELVICIGINNSNEIKWSYAFSWALSGALTADVKTKLLNLYEYTVIMNDNTTNYFAIPINTELKENISDITGIDTALLPIALPLELNKDNIKEIKKSNTPVLTDKTWKEYYNYLNNNLHKFERRSFEEFDYLSVKIKTWGIILIYVLSLISSLGLNLLVSNNSIKEN